MKPTVITRALLTITILSAASCGADDPVSPPPPAATPLTFLYCSDRTGNFELYERTGSVDRQLTDGPTVDSWWPRLEPTLGATCLFYRSDVADRPAVGSGNNNYEFASLWSINLATQQLTELIPAGTNGWNTQGVADWSPDGTKLVMAAQSVPDGNRWHIFVTDPDGSNPTRISTRTSLYLDPSWSPDGQKIVFVAHPVGTTGADLADLEVHVMDADGTNELRLTNDSLRDHDPYYSPDGLEIAFETDVDPTFFGVGRWALRAVAPDGTGIRTIIEDAQINTLPQWSEDSSIIYFQRFVFGGAGAFRIAEVPSAGGTTSDVIYHTDGGMYDDTDISLIAEPGDSAPDAPMSPLELDRWRRSVEDKRE